MKFKIILGVSCFILSLILFFPYNGVKNRIINAISKETGLEIFTGRMWPTLAGVGVSIDNVTLQFPGKSSNNENFDINLNNVKAYVPWMSLIKFSPIAQINGILEKNGRFSISANPKGKQVNLTISVKGLGLQSYLKRFGFTQVDLTGELNVDIKSVVDKKSFEPGKTNVRLKIAKLTMNALEVGGFKIPQLKFKSPGRSTADSKNGKNFKLSLNLGESGDPFILSTEGTFNLDMKAFQKSSFELRNTIRLSTELLKSETVSLVLPLLEQYKKEDGSYRIKITGNFERGTDFPTSF